MPLLCKHAKLARICPPKSVSATWNVTFDTQSSGCRKRDKQREQCINDFPQLPTCHSQTICKTMNAYCLYFYFCILIKFAGFPSVQVDAITVYQRLYKISVTKMFHNMRFEVLFMNYVIRRIRQIDKTFFIEAIA